MAELNSVRERCLPEIESRLASFLLVASHNGVNWNAKMAEYQFSSGGKRLRALIPCLVFDALGKNPLDAVALGCAIEMTHNATLVHDDLQDGDTLRRGIPTVWKKFSEPQSINCGDAMFQFGLQMILELPLDPAIARDMALRSIRAVTAVIEGQAQEFLLKEEPLPTVERYLEVIRGKTAELFAACFGLAARAAGRAPSFCADLEQAGMDLGVLFQIQDDLLDVYGEKGRDKRATDIAEGKVSYLIALLMQNANLTDRERALEILRKPREDTKDHEVLEVVELFGKYGIQARAMSEIDRLREKIRSTGWAAENPPLHKLVMDLTELFLKPLHSGSPKGS